MQETNVVCIQWEVECVNTLVPRFSVWYIHGLGMRLASTDLIVGGRKVCVFFVVCLFFFFFLYVTLVQGYMVMGA